MLLPRLPTYTTASSSSSSPGFDMHTSPSVDPESKRSRDGSEEDREKCTEVMSSEWVEVCFLSGAAGCRGSLESRSSAQGGPFGQAERTKARGAPVHDECVVLSNLGPSGDCQTIGGYVTREERSFCSLERHCGTSWISFKLPEVLISLRCARYTYSQSLWYPSGHPTPARRRPCQRRRLLFCLCRQ
jgi:hypothetical protein